MTKFTIKDFNTKYISDDVCLHEIYLNRYGKLKACPDCKKRTSFYKVSKRKCYSCQHCGYQLHPLAGTIFHKSDTPLKTWFYAIFLFANSKNGVSGKELERQLGVTYKCAWRIAKQIRLLFKQNKTILGSPVEMDETYVGRKTKSWTMKKGHKRGRGAPDKTPVFGIVQREGNIKAIVTPNVRLQYIQPFIEENVEPKSVVYTDEFPTYRRLEKLGFKHKKIRHIKMQYVKRDIHTNTIEGFWSQLKRSINGTYHHVSPKYLQHYVDEFSYRYNLRNSEPSSFFPSMISEVSRQVL